MFKYQKQEVKKIEMKNDWLEVHFLNLGAMLTHLSLTSDLKNCVIGYQNEKEYMTNPLKLSGWLEEHNINIGSLVFDVIAEDDDRFPAIVFSAKKNGVSIRLTTRLLQNSLMMDLFVRSEKEPLKQITINPYFKLDDSVQNGNHLLEISSNKVVSSDNESIISVVNSAFDFRTARPIHSQIKRGHTEFTNTKGINHQYILDDHRKMIVLYSTESKKSLTMVTTFEKVKVDLVNEVDEKVLLEDNQKPKYNNAIGLGCCCESTDEHVIEGRVVLTLKQN